MTAPEDRLYVKLTAELFPGGISLWSEFDQALEDFELPQGVEVAILCPELTGEEYPLWCLKSEASARATRAQEFFDKLRALGIEDAHR